MVRGEARRGRALCLVWAPETTGPHPARRRPSHLEEKEAFMPSHDGPPLPSPGRLVFVRMTFPWTGAPRGGITDTVRRRSSRQWSRRRARGKGEVEGRERGRGGSVLVVSATVAEGGENLQRRRNPSTLFYTSSPSLLSPPRLVLLFSPFFRTVFSSCRDACVCVFPPRPSLSTNRLGLTLFHTLDPTSWVPANSFLI